MNDFYQYGFIGASFVVNNEYENILVRYEFNEHVAKKNCL